MSTTRWIVIKRQYCDVSGTEVELLEKRTYPADRLPDTLGYQVAARSCSHALACNLAGCQCRWAFTAPDVDRLDLARRY